MRDRSFEAQHHRASGLNLVVATIILWNTVYLQKAVQMLADEGTPVPPEYMPHLSPLGWEHINMTGDYVWSLQRVTTLEELRCRPGKSYRTARTPLEAHAILSVHFLLWCRLALLRIYRLTCYDYQPL